MAEGGQLSPANQDWAFPILACGGGGGAHQAPARQSQGSKRRGKNMILSALFRRWLRSTHLEGRPQGVVIERLAQRGGPRCAVTAREAAPPPAGRRGPDDRA